MINHLDNKFVHFFKLLQFTTEHSKGNNRVKNTQNIVKNNEVEEKL